MDLSKLPKLSGKRDDANAPDPTPLELPKDPAAQLPVADGPVRYAGTDTPQPAALSAGPEIWLTIVVGLVLMMIGREFASWALTTLAGGTYDTGVEWLTPEKRGQMVSYWELQGHAALSDSAVFLFGYAMVAEGVLLGLTAIWRRRWRGLLMTAIAITALVTVYNLVAAAVMLKSGMTPLLAILAVGFGVYVCWSLARVLR